MGEYPIRFDITKYLSLSNKIGVELSSDDPQTAGLTGEVQLEIYN